MLESLIEPSAPDALTPDSALTDLRTIIGVVEVESERWASELLVTIGRASSISQLKESQIRYYEELGALQPVTSTGRAGASRLYSLGDLRRLRTLALLSQSYKPAEAAELVRRYAEQVDHSDPVAVDTLLGQERSAVADGFFLARIISQIIAAIQAEIERQVDLAMEAEGAATGACPAPATPHVVGLIYPGSAVFDTPTPTAAQVAAEAERLRRAPTEALVALHQITPCDDPADWAPEILGATGSDDQTLLLYSRTPRPIAGLTGCSFAAYIPADGLAHTVLIALDAPLPGSHAALLAQDTIAPGRVLLLDRLLILVAAIFADFRTVAHGHGYRYRSDGFPLALTRASYASVLALIRRVIFPGDETSMAVLLVPDGLDQPGTLAILAEHGYRDDLLSRAKIALHGEGQGLSGRAYVLREPFVSLHAATDVRVRYGYEEDCQVALAVPLAATWGISPFGVLYLASRRPGQQLESAAIYCALVLGDVLSELLGRWWLTRLRKQQDARLHQQMPAMLAWLDSLDARGPDYERGMAAILRLWAQIDGGDISPLGASLALAVIDINHYRQTIQARSNDPFPVYAQLHVRAAIQRVLGVHFSHYYWFRNDHVLLVLEHYDDDRALTTVERIADQVADSPVQIPGLPEPAELITVRGAVKVLSYRSFHDLGRDGMPALRQRIDVVINLLRERAGRPLMKRTPKGDAKPEAAVFLVT